MAEALYSGGAMHGDIALVEATLSAKEFFHLVSLGVPFPRDAFGAYIGYRTDNDARERATSAGPLTSSLMHEALLRRVRALSVGIMDGLEAISLFRYRDRVVGALCLDLSEQEEENYGLVLFNSTNLVLATGGPGNLYAASVYPEGQHGAMALAVEIGARAANLTEWQFGLGSIKFRWNVSGSYQQAIPRYYSTDPHGKDEREFLDGFFPSPTELAARIFLKGYEWPFDVRKIRDHGSSLIDLLVYRERVDLGRRVFLDYTRNPRGFSPSLLAGDPREYLERRGAIADTPLERLRALNAPAIELYASNGIDLAREPLEVDVCAQHNNGGLVGNLWWESNLKHLFPIGEANGSHGIYRPGGAALNAGQVGGYRAAEFIAERYPSEPPRVSRYMKMVAPALGERISMLKSLSGKVDPGSRSVPDAETAIQERMSRAAAHVRRPREVALALAAAESMLVSLPERLCPSSRSGLAGALRTLALARTQVLCLWAMDHHLRNGGGSRGSWMVPDREGLEPHPALGSKWHYRPCEDALKSPVLEVWVEAGETRSELTETRPIPKARESFEKVWEEFRRRRSGGPSGSVED
jgi:succinate dehydrogenase/fumarate reductase flavoprotein subunit